MKSLTSTLLVVAAIGLAGCSGGFGTDPSDQPGPGASGSGAGAGGVNDPNSPAYFNETIGDRVHFMVDQSTLTDVARATLDGQADWLMRNAEYTAIIEGHADEQGTREYNLALGARRASAVRDYLVSRGVADGRLKTVSYGKERPLEICSDEACYSKNRRAVTVVAAGLSS